MILLSPEEIRRLLHAEDGELIHGNLTISNIIAKAQLKQIVEWENEPCPHTNNPNYFKPRRDCDVCWQVLKKGAGL